MQKTDGTKLVIGTQVSNALPTSTIRLDTKLPPTAGASTLNSNHPPSKNPVHAGFLSTLILFKRQWR
ncbi:hypothetical protein VTP01DRAFT_10872 [Rhizomucor pusillus]|uniref:uncharacterized protein n=1 Tax=Rhizomucor pusillus TaxID=4840 RepID=UPI0037441880